VEQNKLVAEIEIKEEVVFLIRLTHFNIHICSQQ
jgi:hypothetical protein